MKDKLLSFDELISFRNDFECKLGLDRSIRCYGAVVQPENVYKASENFTVQQLKTLSAHYKNKGNPSPGELFVSALLDFDIIPKKEKNVQK